MDNLPQEIVDQILSYLGHHTIQNCRLICKGLSEQTTGRLFQSVNIWFDEQSVQKLSYISETTSIQKHVKELHVDTTQFFKELADSTCRFLNFLWELDHPDDPFDSDIVSFAQAASQWGEMPGNSETDLREARMKYIAFFIKQDKLYSNGYYEEKLREAFKSLPNLRSLILGNTERALNGYVLS
jgi:F-box domain